MDGWRESISIIVFTLYEQLSYLLSYQVIGSCIIDTGNFLGEYFHSNSLISEGCLVHLTKATLPNDVLCAANEYIFQSMQVQAIIR
jgi:hypothetical protein